MAKHDVPMFCVSVSVGLSLSGIAGAAADLTRGILEALPFGATSVIGVKNKEEATNATYVSPHLIPKQTQSLHCRLVRMHC